MITTCLAIACLLQSPTLSDLEAQFKEATSKPGPQQYKKGFELNKEIDKLIEGNKLATADELFRASAIYSDFFDEYEHARVRYELICAAAALGNTEAETKLGLNWDMLQMALGRKRRIGAMKLPPMFDDEPKFQIDATPQCVLAVWSDPAAAKKAAATAKDNPELKQLVDADQAARNTDWSKLTQQQMQDIGKEDKKRLARVVEIVKGGDLHTGEDFHAAALVLQHGSIYDDYRLAHELSIAGMILGRKGANWLAAASYDRMLHSCGQRQRYGTQYGPTGIMTYDPSGIGDVERKAMGCPTLEQAIARKLI